MLLVLALCLVVVVAAFAATRLLRPHGIADDGDAGLPDPPEAAASVPPFSHVYVIVFENHDAAGFVGAATPTFRSLVAGYGSATAYRSITHPSQPNYIALFSGSTQGVTDDEVHDLSGRNLVDELEAAGKTWRVYAENVPLGCYLGAEATNGPDGPGVYARKHEPAISFTDISRNPARCGNISDFAHFDPAAADFELIVPNRCHDMHDCNASTGDAWLAGFLPKITSSAAWQNGGVLFITFDEGTGSGQQASTVPTFVVSKAVRPGFASAVAHDHYSLLRTIESAWNLGCLDEDCDANTLGEFFGG
jgi:acid phosphatase